MAEKRRAKKSQRTVLIVFHERFQAETCPPKNAFLNSRYSTLPIIITFCVTMLLLTWCCSFDLHYPYFEKVTTLNECYRSFLLFILSIWDYWVLFGLVVHRSPMLTRPVVQCWRLKWKSIQSFLYPPDPCQSECRQRCNFSGYCLTYTIALVLNIQLKSPIKQLSWMQPYGNLSTAAVAASCQVWIELSHLTRSLFTINWCLQWLDSQTITRMSFFF